MSTKPFIIRARVQEPMLPTTSEQYDEVQENRIQLVQAINGYLVVRLWLFRLACSTRASS